MTRLAAFASALVVSLAALDPLPAFAQSTPGAGGSIEGSLTLRLRPPRRVANRYPGGAAPGGQNQAVPAVAYLSGAIPGAPAARGQRATMVQRDTAFVPAAVAIPVGGVVDFPNRDPFFHNVISYSEAQRFDLGRYPQGETKQVTFNAPGIVRIYCEVHEFMRSAVVVTENPFHAVVEQNGSFRITGIPPGQYTLVIFHVDAGTVERRITVTEGGTARVQVELEG